MTNEELIAKQRLEIEELKEIRDELLDRLGNICGCLFCIGGPLNDNKLMFNREQKQYLLKIAREAEV